MNVRERISEGLGAASLWGLRKAREVSTASLARRDAEAPPMSEVRDLSIPGIDGPIRARLYVPMGAPAYGPLLLYFHGGGFVIGGLETHDAMCRRLAEAGGMRILSSTYRLAPEHPFPAQLDDALAVAHWLAAHNAEVGAEGGQIAIGGDSAGGYLAVVVAARLSGVFKAQALIYPLLHLDDQVWANSLAQNARVLGRLAVQYIGNHLFHSDTRAHSLLETDELALLPTLIVVGGGADPCAPDATPFADRLRALGADVEVKSYPWLIHGFANLAHMSKSAAEAVREFGELTGAMLRA